jgi:tRNA nucleotidyltransferase/poly(A) polymerase
MADYIYTMETRLTPDQLKGVTLVQDVARNQGMNVYLTGGAIRDILTGFPIRDLDFTVQGNSLKLQKDLERAGVKIDSVDEDAGAIHAILPGNVRAEISMARSEVYEKPGKPPVVKQATINEDLRRRDFTINAIALSLNPGSRGLLLDPSNGSADIEARLIRILHNYAFFEEPSRLIRATRFCARFGWELEERTQARFDAAKESNYIEYIRRDAIGYELEQLAHEENPLNIMKALEREGWLKILHAHFTVAKIDTPELQELMKTRSVMTDFGIAVDAAPAVMYFLTGKMGDKDVTDIQRMLPHREFVTAWKGLEDEAKDLSKRLQSKEANVPSGAWKLLTEAKPEALLFLAVTGKAQSVTAKIENFFGKWREQMQKLPFPEMAEMRITPQLPDYPKLAHEAFLQLIDGKLKSHNEIVKFLEPWSPPPPPPPPPAPARRGRAKAEAKKIAKPVEVPKAQAAAAATVAAAPVPVAEKAKKAEPSKKAEPKVEAKPAKPEPKSAPAKAAAKVPAKAPAKAVAKPVAKPAAKKAPVKAAAKPAPKPVAKKAAKPTKPAPKKPAKAAKPQAKKPAPKKPAPKPAKKGKKK